jgi:ferritin-like metal-binding protein YciE
MDSEGKERDRIDRRRKQVTITPTVIANNSLHMKREMRQDLRDKFILYLNSALAMENAALERVQRRIEQTVLEDVKQQLQRHLEETRQHQDRLRRIIMNIGAGLAGLNPTEEKGQLPIATPPRSIIDKIHESRTSLAEQDLMQSVEDMIVENAEVIGYNLLIQMAEKMNIGETIPYLRQSLDEEEKMFGWLRANTPAMFAKLWPQIDGSSYSSVSNSKTRTTVNDIESIDQTFKCETCNETFRSREDLKNHTMQNHE